MILVPLRVLVALRVLIPSRLLAFAHSCVCPSPASPCPLRTGSLLTQTELSKTPCKRHTKQTAGRSQAGLQLHPETTLPAVPGSQGSRAPILLRDLPFASRRVGLLATTPLLPPPQNDGGGLRVPSPSSKRLCCPFVSQHQEEPPPSPERRRRLLSLQRASCAAPSNNEHQPARGFLPGLRSPNVPGDSEEGAGCVPAGTETAKLRRLCELRAARSSPHPFPAAHRSRSFPQLPFAPQLFTSRLFLPLENVSA